MIRDNIFQLVCGCLNRLHRSTQRTSYKHESKENDGRGRGSAVSRGVTAAQVTTGTRAASEGPERVVANYSKANGQRILAEFNGSNTIDNFVCNDDINDRLDVIDYSDLPAKVCVNGNWIN